MEKVKTQTYVLLYVSESILLILRVFGLRLETNFIVYMLLGMLISVAAVIFKLMYNNENNSKVRNVFDIILIPLAFVNSALAIMAHQRVYTLIYVFVSFACCLIISLSNSRQIIFKSIISVLLSLLLFVFVPFAFFGKNTVVTTAESPSGRYYAEVIDNDQGALGGNTYVNAVKRVIKAPIFSITKPKNVYEGTWADFKDMEISWKNDECLVINGREYLIT